MAKFNDALREKMNQKRSLPASHSGMLPLWEQALADIATTLTGMLNRAVAASPPTLTMIGSRQLEEDVAEPGFLFSLKVDDQEGFYAFLKEPSGLTIAQCLLNSCTESERSNLSPLPIDGDLLRTILSPIATSLQSWFDIKLEIDENQAVLTEWPFQAPGEETPYLLSTLSFTLSESETIEICFCFPVEHSAFIVPTNEKITFNTDLLCHLEQCTVNIDVEIDQWTTNVQFLQTLAPGAILDLAGASMEDLSLLVGSGASAIRVGRGEHGRSGRKQAARVTHVG